MEKGSTFLNNDIPLNCVSHQNNFVLLFSF